MANDELEQVTAPDREAWRRWLEANHATARAVWLVYAKKDSGLRSVTYDEAVEEALCFGWIDSKVQRVDERHYRQYYSRRKTGSIWSRLNKDRIEKVVREGRMTPAGRAVIDAAIADGSWALLDDIDNVVVPPDLQAALDAVPAARRNFDAFTDSVMKPTLWWIASAKRADTRAKRIARVVSQAALGKSVAEE